MPGRKSLIDTLWLLFSLAFLAWVLIAPNRNCGWVAVSSRPNCHRGDFARPQVEPTAHLRVGMADDAVPDGNALAWEDEEQDRVEALNEPRASLLITGSLRKVLTHRVISPCSILSHYPIRC